MTAVAAPVITRAAAAADTAGLKQLSWPPALLVQHSKATLPHGDLLPAASAAMLPAAAANAAAWLSKV